MEQSRMRVIKSRKRAMTDLRWLSLSLSGMAGLTQVNINCVR